MPRKLHGSRLAALEALARKEWWHHRGALGGHAAMILVALTLLPGDSPLGFAVYGTFLSIGTGVRLGGHDAAHGHLEFLFSRPIERNFWISVRFAFGLAILAAAWGIFALADAVQSHASLWQTLSDLPVREPVRAAPTYGLTVSWLVFAYALAFSLGASATRPKALAGSKVSAFILTMTLGGAALQVGRAFVGARDIEELVFETTGRTFMTSAFLGFAVLLFVAARSRLLTREV